MMGHFEDKPVRYEAPKMPRKVHRTGSGTGVIYLPKWILNTILRGAHEVELRLYNDHIEIWPVGGGDDKD